MQLKTPVDLVLAASSDSMLIVRLTAAGVLARAGATMERMDALKSAVEEACNCLVTQDNPPERMALRFFCECERLNFKVECVQSESLCGDIDETEAEIIRCILQGVADEVHLDIQNGRLQGIELSAALC